MQISLKDQFAVGSEDWIRAQARAYIKTSNINEYIYVRDVFTDRVIAEIEGDGIDKSALVELPFTLTGETITFGEIKNVSVEYVAKQRAAIKSTLPELTGPLVWKQEDKRLAFGAVLVPGEPDSDGDVLTAEKIADVAHDWLAEYGNIDLQHSLNNAAQPVESFLLPAEMDITLKSERMTLPAGTWILGSRITDDDLWDKVQKGELTGYSVMGVKRAAMKSADMSLKRTTLKDLGEDWVAPFVSLVDAPAVPKAKFYALKAKPRGFFSRFCGGSGTITKEKKTMEDKEILEVISKSVAEAVKPFAEKLDALTVEKETEPEGDTPDGGGIDKAVKELEAKIETADKEGKEFRESMKAKLDELTEKLTPSKSRALKSQDGETGNTTETPAEPKVGDRDSFGRRIKA